MNPLTNYHALLPYHLEQLEQERRLARRRQAAALARRTRRVATATAAREPVVTLAATGASDRSEDLGLQRAA